MDSEKKFVGKWWVWLVFLMICTGIVFTGLSYFGFVGKTIVERVVFEKSFQYSEARKSAVATYTAQLVEIDRKLTNPDLEKSTRRNLEAQASGLRIQLSTERSKQQ